MRDRSSHDLTDHLPRVPYHRGGTLSSNFASMWKNPGLFVKDHEAEIRYVLPTDTASTLARTDGVGLCSTSYLGLTRDLPERSPRKFASFDSRKKIFLPSEGFCRTRSGTSSRTSARCWCVPSARAFRRTLSAVLTDRRPHLTVTYLRLSNISTRSTTRPADTRARSRRSKSRTETRTHQTSEPSTTSSPCVHAQPAGKVREQATDSHLRSRCGFGLQEKGEEVRNLEAQLRDSEAATARMTADAGPLAARHADIVNRMKADKAKYKALEVSPPCCLRRGPISAAQLTSFVFIRASIAQEEMVIKAQEVVKKKNDVQHWDKATEPAEVAVAQAESDLQTLEDELADWTTSCVRLETRSPARPYLRLTWPCRYPHYSKASIPTESRPTGRRKSSTPTFGASRRASVNRRESQSQSRPGRSSRAS